LLNLKSLDTLNQIHLLAEADINGKLQIVNIYAVADGVLHYKLDLCTLIKRMFIPASHIPLK
jgi:hypothetical protein